MSWMDIIGRILSQVTSGRWLITIAAIYCLTKLTETLCILMATGKVTLETATYVAICMSVLNTVGMVTVFYFQKPRNSEDLIVTDTPETTTTTTTLPPTK